MKQRIGAREAWLWLGTVLFFVVQVAAYLRFSLEQLFQLFLRTFQIAGMLIYIPGSLILTVGLYFWLGKLFPTLLTGPLKAIESGEVDLESKDHWRILLSLNGIFGLGVLYIYLTDPGPPSGWQKLFFYLSILFLILFIASCLWAGRFTRPSSNSEYELNGPAAELSLIICKVSVWSNAFFTLAIAIYRPYMTMFDCRAIGIKVALLGTVIGLFAGKHIKARLVYLLGLLVSILGGAHFGIPAARAISLGFVLIFQLAEGRGLKTAGLKTWAFGFGQSLGRLLGAPIGAFFIGLEGWPMGAAFGEAIAALVSTHFLVAGSPSDG